MTHMLRFRAVKDFNIAKAGEVWELSGYEYKLLPYTLKFSVGMYRDHYYTLTRNIDLHFAKLELTTKDLENNFEWVRSNTMNK